MKSVSRALPALILAAAVDLAAAAPVKPVLPCDRPVHVFGGSQVIGEGVRNVGSNDFVTRVDVFFRRVCGAEIPLAVIAEERGRVISAAAKIADTVTRNPRGIAFVHFPISDVESGVPVDALLAAYRRILDACARAGSICIIGGQLPANALSEEQSERQVEIERRAAAAFGSRYLPLYRYFQSESHHRRLMQPMDSGDGRMIDDLGHELLFRIYRRRLLELTGSAQ